VHEQRRELIRKFHFSDANNLDSHRTSPGQACETKPLKRSRDSSQDQEKQTPAKKRKSKTSSAKEGSKAVRKRAKAVERCPGKSVDISEKVFADREPGKCREDIDINREIVPQLTSPSKSVGHVAAEVEVGEK